MHLHTPQGAVQVSNLSAVVKEIASSFGTRCGGALWLEPFLATLAPPARAGVTVIAMAHAAGAA